MIGISLEKSLVDGDEKLVVFSRNNLYLMGKLRVFPDLERCFNVQGKFETMLFLYLLTAPEGLIEIISHGLVEQFRNIFSI